LAQGRMRSSEFVALLHCTSTSFFDFVDEADYPDGRILLNRALARAQQTTSFQKFITYCGMDDEVGGNHRHDLHSD